MVVYATQMEQKGYGRKTEEKGLQRNSQQIAIGGELIYILVSHNVEKSMFFLQAWLKLLNVEKTMEENAGVYKRMLELAREFSTEVC